MGNRRAIGPMGLGRGRRGFTLPELLVAVVVALLVLAGVHRIFVAGLRSEVTTSTQTEVDRKAQVAMDNVISRLRGGSGVEDVQASRIAFIDQDGHNVRYWVEGERLYGAVDASDYSDGNLLASGVTSFALECRDVNGQPAVTPDQVEQVVVQLEVRRDGYLSRLKSSVSLRNK
jgi:prepilin-type N-terminal cleavage/methylation domain-containing protein